jgi:L-aspartate oxidase
VLYSDSARFDVLVIGGGAAGLYTALCLPSHLQVGLISKEPLVLSASDWAQGGIAAAIAPEDSPALHITDTLKAGAGLCEPEAVRLLVEEAPRCIQNLLRMGVEFDRHSGLLSLTLEAAHSRRRVLHAADTTGRAIVTTLIAETLARKNIQVLEQAFVLDLWLENQRCCGVSLLHRSRLSWLRAGAVILATGGGGQVYAQTTNPALSTGDGVAMAWRAGAQLRDLEFVQFHPTALNKPGAPRFLISEAVRGEGAHLIDAAGRRFAFDYHPDGELAPRDVVSRAIFDYLQQSSTAADHVWLDLRPIPADKIRQRFPNIIQICQHWGVDVLQEPIPVGPAAHYWMGGITVDQLSRTTIANLYAVGETASTGVHGANRLASNSLLECLVFGAQLASLEIASVAPKSAKLELVDWNDQILTNAVVNKLTAWRQALSRLVWQSAGISRQQDVMQQGLEQVEAWQQEFAALELTQSLLTALDAAHSLQISDPAAMTVLRQWGELRNLLDVADLMLKSALFRTESRGGHYRADYPQTDPNWQAHTIVTGQTWQRSEPIAVVR